MLQWILGYLSLFQFWFPHDICLVLGLLGYMVVLFLVFKGISVPSSVVAVSIYIPTNSARGFLFLHTLSAFIVCRLFDVGHSDWCEVVSHCSFDLHFSNNEWCWASFHVFVSHLYVFFGDVCLGLFPRFDWVVCFSDTDCMSCFHILEINPLSVFCYCFLPFWGFSFHLVCSFLCCARDFKLKIGPTCLFLFLFPLL